MSMETAMKYKPYPAYKESGVEWLGEVPEHWKTKRLKYSLRLLTEKTDRRENPIALENIQSWSGRFIPTETVFEGEGVAFSPGDILFGKLRPYLATWLSLIFRRHFGFHQAAMASPTSFSTGSLSFFI